MLKNHNFDLVHALSKKSSALWRYKNEYLKNSEGCEHCRKMWQKIMDDDDEHVEMLKQEIKRHVDENRFD